MIGQFADLEHMLIGGIDSEDILGFGVTTQCPAQGFFTKNGPPRTVVRTVEKFCPEQGGGGVAQREARSDTGLQQGRDEPTAHGTVSVVRKSSCGGAGGIALTRGHDGAKSADSYGN